MLIKKHRNMDKKGMTSPMEDCKSMGRVKEVVKLYTIKAGSEIFVTRLAKSLDVLLSNHPILVKTYPRTIRITMLRILESALKTTIL